MMMPLNPPMPLDTPKGPAFAHPGIDYGQELALDLHRCAGRGRSDVP
jgi:hypothetical protein